MMQQSINQIIIAPRGIRLFCASPSWLNLRPFHERKNVHGTENPSLRSVISAWEDPVHKEKMAACTMADRLVRNVNRDFPSFYPSVYLIYCSSRYQSQGLETN